MLHFWTWVLVQLLHICLLALIVSWLLDLGMRVLNALKAILYCNGLGSWCGFSYTLVITLLYLARLSAYL